MNIQKVDTLRDASTMEIKLGELTFTRFGSRGKFRHVMPDTNISIIVLFVHDTGGSVYTDANFTAYEDFKYIDNNTNVDMDDVKDKTKAFIHQIVKQINERKQELQKQVDLWNKEIENLSLAFYNLSLEPMELKDQL